MNLQELRSFISTDNSEQQELILEAVYNRLELEIPEDGLLPKQVRVITMHGAKGLNADVVFIPGLEDAILPSERRAKIPGLVQESARQLYVSTTRARIACFVSYAKSRTVSGQPDFKRTASRFCKHLTSTFSLRSGGISNAEADEIIDASTLYKSHTQTRLSQ